MGLTFDNLLQLVNGHSRKIATAISVLLIVLMSFSVAKTVLFFLEMSAPVSLAPGNRSLPDPAGLPHNYRLSDLELFGKESSTATIPEAVDAPETRLNLELQGVFIAEDEKLSTAIVAEKNRNGELFAIGDRLPGNAILAAVHVDHVLIRRGSRMEKLMFSDSEFRVAEPDEETDLVSSATGDQERDSRLDQLRNRLRNAPQAMNPDMPDDVVNPAREALEEYQQRLQADPEGALAELGISAVASGESRGYSVGEEAQGAIRQAGLQPGDVILSVNGRAVGDITSDSSLVEQVMASSRVRVEVQRGKRRFFLTVPVPR